MAQGKSLLFPRVRRALWVLAALGLVSYGYTMEHHPVVSLNGGTTTQFSGPAFVKAETVDAFALHDDQIVAPLTGTAVTAKDCKT